MLKSAFCGKIDEFPGILVDNFENPQEVKARAYFLSHCHSDHTQGLHSEALITTLEKTGACIYMSELSAAIVDDDKTDARIMKYVRPLPLGSELITLPSNPDENIEELLLTVTLIPAGHSFGSVMFLFQTNKKTVLFTGDFRMSPNDLSKYKPFHKGTDPIHIDAMYVDTTFVGHRYQNFPKRSESVSSMLHVINKHLEHPDNRIALHTSAKYGYEFVYNEIYNKLGIKVYVGEQRWKFFGKLVHLVPGVTNDANSTIHLCRNQSEKRDHTKCLPTTQDSHNYLYIHFSAMKWDYYEVDEKCLNKLSDNRIDVCFATHCSRSELLYFVNYFNPKRVVGFPDEYPKDDNICDIFKVDVKKRKLNVSDNKNKFRKVDRDLIKLMFEV